MGPQFYFFPWRRGGGKGYRLPPILLGSSKGGRGEGKKKRGRSALSSFKFVHGKGEGGGYAEGKEERTELTTT